jgi:hypothetical protein
MLENKPNHFLAVIESMHFFFLVKFLIRNNSTHFMCVHSRRTDFFSDVLLGTDEYGKNFTNPAIEFVYEFLQVWKNE